MNCVYVDDVVSATLLALASPTASGRAYNITDGATPAAARLHHLHRPVARPARARPSAYRRRWPCHGLLRREYIGHLVGLKRAPLLNISRLRFLYYNQHYSIARARAELGYSPRFTYREGLPPTLDWFSASERGCSELLGALRSPSRPTRIVGLRRPRAHSPARACWSRTATSARPPRWPLGLAAAPATGPPKPSPASSPSNLPQAVAEAFDRPQLVRARDDVELWLVGPRSARGPTSASGRGRLDGKTEPEYCASLRIGPGIGGKFPASIPAISDREVV